MANVAICGVLALFKAYVLKLRVTRLPEREGVQIRHFEFLSSRRRTSIKLRIARGSKLPCQ